SAAARSHPCAECGLAPWFAPRRSCSAPDLLPGVIAVVGHRRARERTERSDASWTDSLCSSTPLAAAALLACQASPPPADAGEWAGTMDTPASGRIIVRNPDAPLWRPGEAWALREQFRLGATEGEGADVFGEIGDVELGPDGALHVRDAQASEVRVFGSDGAHLRTLGRRGRGPGELENPTGMAFDAHGPPWVMDWGNGRYSGFDPNTGALVKEARRLAGFAMVPWPGRFDRSNAVRAGALVGGASGRRHRGRRRTRVPAAPDRLPRGHRAGHRGGPRACPGHRSGARLGNRRLPGDGRASGGRDAGPRTARPLDEAGARHA